MGTMPSVLSKQECVGRLLPVQDALDILQGKWKLLIVVTLTYGPKRFKQIQRDIDGITAKMLSKELKDLEMNELVERTVYATTPVTVEYSMTPYGHTLKKLIAELHNWGTQHRKRVMRKGK